MQDRNIYKTVLDFITDESFQRWVKGEEDLSNWEDWTLENTERAKLVAEARLWIIAMKVEEEVISSQQTQDALYITWSKIRNSNSPSKISQFLKSFYFKSVAAVLLFGLLFVVLYTNHSLTTSETISPIQNIVQIESNGLIEQINNTNKSQLITLSDASSILLQPGSKLSYPKNFKGNERKVFLTGEAFFEMLKGHFMYTLMKL